MSVIKKHNLKSTKIILLVLVLLSSLSLSQNIKIQLDEKLNFVGLDNYDSVFKNSIISIYCK